MIDSLPFNIFELNASAGYKKTRTSAGFVTSTITRTRQHPPRKEGHHHQAHWLFVEKLNAIFITIKNSTFDLVCQMARLLLDEWAKDAGSSPFMNEDKSINPIQSESVRDKAHQEGNYSDSKTAFALIFFTEIES
jgi:hypothetical protein